MVPVNDAKVLRAPNAGYARRLVDGDNRNGKRSAGVGFSYALRAGVVALFAHAKECRANWSSSGSTSTASAQSGCMWAMACRSWSAPISNRFRQRVAGRRDGRWRPPRSNRCWTVGSATIGECVNLRPCARDPSTRHNPKLSPTVGDAAPAMCASTILRSLPASRL